MRIYHTRALALAHHAEQKCKSMQQLQQSCNTAYTCIYHTRALALAHQAEQFAKKRVSVVKAPHTCVVKPV